MPIAGRGWEMHVVRAVVQHDPASGVARTVGHYQVYHAGILQTAPGLAGATAEARGPGANSPTDNGRRVEPGRYPVWTQRGDRYVTWGYVPSEELAAEPKPAFELRGAGERTEILVHPGHGFLASIGCIDPCGPLPGPHATIAYAPSRRRVIALIENMRRFVGESFPVENGVGVPGAFVVIDGEP